MVTRRNGDDEASGGGKGEPSDMSRSARRRQVEQALCEGLCHLLGNTCRLARATMTFGWNENGPGASARDTLLAAQAKELHRALDTIAAHAAGLGIAPVLDYTDVNLTLRLPTLSDAEAGLPAGAAALNLLAEAHAEAAGSVEAAIDVALMAESYASLMLMTARLEAHRSHARTLRREIA